MVVALVEHVAELDVQWLSVLAGFIIPVLVALTTKLNAARGVKAVMNFGLAALATLVATAIDNQGLITESALFTFAMTWATSVATYYGLWEPVSITTRLANKTARIGVGGG